MPSPTERASVPRSRAHRTVTARVDAAEVDDPDVPVTTDVEADEPVVLDRNDDRWAWRRRIRADPRKHFVYRIGVGVAGLFFVILAGLTGPLPGPGGIPLLLVGLAIWASEFEWAQRVMSWVKRRVGRARTLPWPLKVLLVIGIVCGICLGLYLSMRFAGGVPGWLPDVVRDTLGTLPGL